MLQQGDGYKKGKGGEVLAILTNLRPEQPGTRNKKQSR